MKKRKRCRQQKAAASASAAHQVGVADSAAAETVAKSGKRKKARARARAAASVVEEDVEHDEEEEEEVDEDGDSDSGEDREWDVDFELFEPDEEDFHSVKDMLTSGTWDFADLNFSELADSIVRQGNIGNLVKSGKSVGDEDATVCALLTILNLQQFSHQSWPAALRKSVLAKAAKSADPSVKTKLEGILTAKTPTQVGFLFSERFANLPPQLIPPLHKAVLDDIDWSCSTPKCPPEERPFYQFTHILGIARCTDAVSASSSKSPLSGGARVKRRKQAATSTGGVSYLHSEDEFYVKRSDFSFVFAMPDGKRGGDGEAASTKRRGGGPIPEKRTVYCLSRKAFEAAIAEVQTALKTE